MSKKKETNEKSCSHAHPFHCGEFYPVGSPNDKASPWHDSIVDGSSEVTFISMDLGKTSTKESSIKILETK